MVTWSETAENDLDVTINKIISNHTTLRGIF